MERPIRTAGLTKHYGHVVGIEDVDLEVPAGEVFGFLGPNGAGKTTTIRLLVDVLRPTAGRVSVLGEDPRGNPALRRRIGYLPGELSLYDDMTGRGFLDWSAALRGGVDRARVDDLLDRLDLDPSRPIRDLSSGNKQKVGLVQALMHDPDLLILDEPTRGLDPLVQQQFHRILREVRDEGRTVFLSSHVLDEVEAVADRVGIVRGGRLVTVQTIPELRARTAQEIEIRFAEPVPAAAFEGLDGVRESRIDGTVARFVLDGFPDALVKAAADFRVESLTSHAPDLEDVFLTYYEEDQRA